MKMKDKTKLLALGSLTLMAAACHSVKSGEENTRRPNILLAISDDQSYPYCSVYGTTGISTPAFDQVAQNGILFNNAFVAAPQCSPSRAAILTGLNIWQLEEAGTHSSYFPKKFQVFTDLLEDNGYWIGYTGKGWAPGNWKGAGWSRNPAGPEYNDKKLDTVPTTGISHEDYFGNFVEFYQHKASGQPFFFWYGGHEPHRTYEDGSGYRAGMRTENVFLPGFLPPDSIVLSDIEDYELEIEWFDRQLGKMLNFLKEKGELNNTIVVVTSDNGMPFPASKANLMEYGSHVPLAISWPAKIRGGQKRDQMVSLIDLAPTFLDMGEVKDVPEMTGKNMTNILLRGGDSKWPVDREFVLTGRERHSDSRPDDLGYPSRAIRNNHFLYIMNLKPDLWPAGNPPPPFKGKEIVPKGFKAIGMGYCDIDDGPTKEYIITHEQQWPAYFKEGYEKRPAEQLYDIRTDPACMHNLATDPDYDTIRTNLQIQLRNELTRQGDPRMLGYGDIFDSYPRFGLMRDFPGFKKKGEYNPEFQIKNE